MKAIQEDKNGYEVFYHGINEWSFNRLMTEANGKVEDIVLYGRVFNPEMDLLEAESEGDYEEVRGQGYVYACDYDNREQATPGASATAGVTLILGYNGKGHDEEINKHGEYLVPLSSYTVIGVVEE